MNENAKMWARELPNFKQGKPEMLGSADLGYCCLGVACALYERETGAQLPRYKDGRYNGEYAEELCKDFGAVREWLGLSSEAGHFDDGCLAQLNDQGATFTKIQQIILSEPEGLFVEG